MSEMELSWFRVIYFREYWQVCDYRTFDSGPRLGVVSSLDMSNLVILSLCRGLDKHDLSQ